jgi:streptogramin lyase
MRGIKSLVAVLLTLLAVGTKAAGISEFSVPQAGPGHIVTGPDGDLWFTEDDPYPASGVGRIAPNGAVSHFALPATTFVASAASQIAVGSDHNLWFTEAGIYNGTGAIGRITTDGVVTEFPLPAFNGSLVRPISITSGPDGNLWFTAEYDTQTSQNWECTVITGRITPSGTITEFPFSTLNAFGLPMPCIANITAGPDGNVWFTAEKSLTDSSIYKITPSGTVTEFHVPYPGIAADIVNGPDGNLWFTGLSESEPFIGRITPAGVFAEFPLPIPAARMPALVTRGSDGNLWFTEQAGFGGATLISNAIGIGKITTDGTITEYPVPLSSDSRFIYIDGITTGPDGRLWMTDNNYKRIGAFAPSAISVPVEASFSGAWFDPAQSGHGLFLEVLSDHRFLAWWFTFAPDGGQAWFGGVGTYSGNKATITQVALTTGGRFIPNFDPTTITNTLWGEFSFTFDDCNHGHVDFDSVVGFGSGSMELTRLTQIDGTTCPHADLDPVPVTTPSSITEYPVFTPTGDIVSGPDGNLWFIETGATAIGMITPSGTSTSFPLPAGDTAPNSNIVVGPDRNLWFVEGGVIYNCPNSTFCPTPPCISQTVDLRVGKITPYGVVESFVFPSDGRSTHGIATGADGNLWFTKGDNIARITPSGTLTEFQVPTPNSSPFAIARGADGNLWFTEYAANRIGRITVNGVIEEFALPDDANPPSAIINGPDGNLWFIAATLSDSRGFLGGNIIGRITPAGVITEFAAPAGITSIASGPDGNTWFTELTNDKLGKITPAGVITELVTVGRDAYPADITAGPDGKLWFAGGGQIGTFATSLSTPISSAFSGAWFDPSQSGHGLFVEVLPDSRFLAWWFTFAPEGGQAWFGGVGTYSGSVATITQVAITTGGRFIPNFNPTSITNTLWGTLTFTFDDCNHGRVDFDSVVGYGTGSMPLTRLTQIDGTACP